MSIVLAEVEPGQYKGRHNRKAPLLKAQCRCGRIYVTCCFPSQVIKLTACQHCCHKTTTRQNNGRFASPTLRAMYGGGL